MRRYAALALVLSACSQRGWAEGTWKLDAATMQLIRDDVHSLPEGIVASTLDAARLEIAGETAKIHVAATDDPPPFEYSAQHGDDHVLRLSGPHAGADLPPTIELLCEAAHGGVCSSLRVITLGMLKPAEAIRLIRDE